MNDISIKQQIIEIYEDSKKIIENHIICVNSEIKKIKNQYELFFKKSLEIINENERKSVLKYNLTSEDYDNTIINSPIRIKSKTPLKGRSSNHLKNYHKFSSDFNLKKPNNQTKKNLLKNNNKMNKNKLISHKNNFSFTKSTITQNIAKVITKNKLKNLQKNIKSNKKNSINSTTSNQSNFNSMSVSSNHSFSNLDSKINFQVNNNNSLINSKKQSPKLKLGINKNIIHTEPNNKNNNEVLRKFSIIDIPSLSTIQEKGKKINLNNDDNNMKNDISFNNDDNNLVINKIDKIKDKCFYLVSKNDVVPLSIRLFFSKNIKILYNYNPPSQILNDYLKLLDSKINKLNYDLMKNFYPSITAQSNLYFFQKEDEKLLFNINISNEEEKKNTTNLLRLILLTCGRTYKEEMDYKFLINELKKISNNNIRKFYTNIENFKNINNLSENSINSFIDISEKNKNLFNINCQNLPLCFEKFLFYLKEVYDFFLNKKNNILMKNKFQEEKTHIQEKIIYSKIK